MLTKVVSSDFGGKTGEKREELRSPVSRGKEGQGGTSCVRKRTRGEVGGQDCLLLRKGPRVKMSRSKIKAARRTRGVTGTGIEVTSRHQDIKGT